MENLPTDLHCYLSQLLDKSTAIIFPLTCKTLWQSLGSKRITSAEAVKTAAGDDNLRLLQYFLTRATKHSRHFYNQHILQSALSNNATAVLNWYFNKKYSIGVGDISAAVAGINLETLNLALSKASDGYKLEYILSSVIEYDRVDIFTRIYLETKFPITGNFVAYMFAKDAVRCLIAFLRQTTLPTDFEMNVARGFKEGGPQIVNYMGNRWTSRYKAKSLPRHLLDLILSNPRYNFLKFFEKVTPAHALTEEQMCLVICYKNLEVVQFMFKNVDIKEEHCKAALERSAYLGGEVIDYIFARFQGKILVETRLFLPKVDLDALAEKLVNVECLYHDIIVYRNVPLFRRLVPSLEFNLDQVHMLVSYYDRTIFEIYLEHIRIPAKYHVYCYNRIGEEFVELLRAKGHTVSTQVDKRRLQLAERKQREEEILKSLEEVNVENKKRLRDGKKEEGQKKRRIN